MKIWEVVKAIQEDSTRVFVCTTKGYKIKSSSTNGLSIVKNGIVNTLDLTGEIAGLEFEPLRRTMPFPEAITSHCRIRCEKSSHFIKFQEITDVLDKMAEHAPLRCFANFEWEVE